MTAAEYLAMAAEVEQEVTLFRGVTGQTKLRGLVLTDDRFDQELDAADRAYTTELQAAVSGHGDWCAVQVARDVVRQCRAALKAAGRGQA